LNEYKSYRLGLSVVSGALALGALVATILPAPPHRSAGQETGDRPQPLGAFRLTDPAGRPVTDVDLAGGVWIASFTFTRCPSSCPKITQVMKGLQTGLRGTGVKLVNISVDPEHDTPEVLSRYANAAGALPDRWRFLTGDKDEVYRLILDRFRVSVAESSPADRAQGADAVMHSDRLALVDRGNRVVGSYRALDPEEADAPKVLLARARRLDAPAWVRGLPVVNATLNGSCALLLLVGWALIRAGRVRPHAACMVAGVVVSALFLSSYLTYHFHAGSVPFLGVGPARFLYFTILLSHTLLAVSMLPLIAMTLLRAVRQDFVRHARIARITYPIWLYVSITGVVIYLMLYRMPQSPGGRTARSLAANSAYSGLARPRSSVAMSPAPSSAQKAAGSSQRPGKERLR